MLVVMQYEEVAGTGSTLNDYNLSSNQRPVGVRPKKVRKPSAEKCLEFCIATGRDCGMITFRMKGGRCFLYTDTDAKRLLSGNSKKRKLVPGETFTTYILRELVASECIHSDDLKQIQYRGTRSITASGTKCQKWSVDKPHKPNYRPSDNGGSHNYCRNPDNDGTGAWCYTVKKTIRWEYCEIPRCAASTEFPPTPGGVSTTTPEPTPAPCIVCNGRDYTGTVSRTESGKTCQRWDSNSPHMHGNHPDARPDLNLEGNYCRNPDGDIRPWCYTTDPSTRWEYCEFETCRSVSGAPIVPNFTNTTECYVASGSNYRGRVSRSMSGRTCMSWSSQHPHAHSNTPDNYPCSGLDENYCRNPSSSFESGPWCYTTDATMRWELCDVPKCGPDGRPITTTTPRVTTSTTITTAPTTAPPPRNCGSPVVSPNININSVVDEASSRILGGEEAIHGSWPWMVSIRVTYRPDDSHFCGGALIDPSWVLTAAHCLDDGTDPRLLLVRMGHHTGNEPEAQSRRVRRYILHEDYSKTNVMNDIALMQLESPFLLTDYVKLACLPEPNYIVPGGTNCVVSGWGYTYDPHYKNALKEAVMPVHSYEKCIHFSRRHMLDRTQLCAGVPNSGQDTCRGDSGGPLSCYADGFWTVQGVTSWGSSCESKKGHYGSYTRVSKYIGWIQLHMS